MRLRIVLSLAGLALLAGFTVTGARPAHADATTCPVTGAGAYQSCVLMPDSPGPAVGQQITAGAGTNPGTPWLVTDSHGAPMAWVNLYGLYSGGAPGLPGGLICTTNVLKSAACLTPDRGTVELFDANGQNPVRLTRRDVIFLHHLEATP